MSLLTTFRDSLHNWFRDKNINYDALANVREIDGRSGRELEIRFYTPLGNYKTYYYNGDFLDLLSELED